LPDLNFKHFLTDGEAAARERFDSFTLALVRAVEEGLLHPGFLMIDSPEKNLSPDKVGDTDFLDPKIVERMWTHMKRWSEHRPQAQLLIVENMPPSLVDDDVIIRFSRDPENPHTG
jgi:hypothetical protein